MGNGIKYIDKLIDSIMSKKLPLDLVSGADYYDVIVEISKMGATNPKAATKANAILLLLDLKLDTLLESTGIQIK